MKNRPTFSNLSIVSFWSIQNKMIARLERVGIEKGSYGNISKLLWLCSTPHRGVVPKNCFPASTKSFTQVRLPKLCENLNGSWSKVNARWCRPKKNELGIELALDLYNHPQICHCRNGRTPLILATKMVNDLEMIE